MLGQIRIVQDVWFYCRYYQLCEDSLAPEMVAPLQKHWVESMCQYVPRKLVKNFPEATQDFVQVNNCSYGVMVYGFLSPALISSCTCSFINVRFIIMFVDYYFLYNMY